MSTALTPMESAVFSYEHNFNAVNAYKMNFKKEASFALQLLKNSDFLRSTAQNNPDSLQNALTNIAAIGISLNPATKEAYLVPRGKAVCLDISAIGLIKLATDSGSILWGQAKLVHKNDTYKNLGAGEKPLHSYEAFGDRGPVVGVYVVVKTRDGDYLAEEMTLTDCHAIRDRSEAWKAFKAKKTQSCPWETDEGEMMKKTVIKRAQKYWPKSERVDEAIKILNEHEGIDFSARGAFASAPTQEAFGDDAIAKVKELLATHGRSEDQLLKYINTKFKTEFKTLDDFEPTHIEEALKAMKVA